jgi:hypothetical protein
VSHATKFCRLGVSLGADEGSRVAAVLALASEDITPPMMAMPMVPESVSSGLGRMRLCSYHASRI